MKLYDDLKYRGLIQDVTAPDLEDILNNEKITFYIGTDPTADSMHIGHYSSFLISKRLAKYGHKPILLIGGATGLIGDPKPTEERDIISKEEVNKNVTSLTKQAKDIFGFEVVNNYDWTKDISTIDFLRDYGKHFNVNYMLAKDKVKTRLETGITFTEFSYMILQALDFYYLFKNHNCVLQVAGSDQWGNITSGVELIRKKLDKKAYGLVMPLVTDSNGVKFGKTEGNALWLDKNKTSSYELYQYLINTDDSTVIDYLKKLTFLPKEEIEEIELKHDEDRGKRIAQISLAREVITDLHGKDEFLKAKKISETLFTGEFKNLTEEELKEAFHGVPEFEIKESTTLLELLVNNNICSSRREAREFLSNGSITLNGEKVNDESMIVDKSSSFHNLLIIRKGKKKYYIGVFI
jgi:tyrosyl-tRNA synthetase